MRANEIILAIMAKTNKSKAELGRAVGIEAPEGNKSYPSDVINKRLKQKTMSVEMFSQMLGAMGYTIIVAPKGTRSEYEVKIDE